MNDEKAAPRVHYTEKLEIDQSVRIEELTRDTIIGIANADVSFTATVRKHVKRSLYEHFRRLGMPKQFAPIVFASAVIVAYARAPFHASDLVVDIEYPGYEQKILRIITRRHPHLHVYFTTIGKKSPAHFVAYGVHRGKRKTDHQIRLSALYAIVCTEIKNDPRTVTQRNESADSQST